METVSDHENSSPGKDQIKIDIINWKKNVKSYSK